MSVDDIIKILKIHKNDKATIEYRDGKVIIELTKPEPKEIWVNEYRSCISSYRTKEEALRLAASHAIRVAVKYREVIEDA